MAVAETLQTAWCFDCKQFKPVEAFAKNKSRKSGLNQICRSCKSIRAKHHWVTYEHDQSKRVEANQVFRAKQCYDGPYDRINPVKLFNRDKGICGICKKPVTLEDSSIDHVIPLSRGGKHLWTNVQIAHKSCNAEKSNL